MNHPAVLAAVLCASIAGSATIASAQTSAAPQIARGAYLVKAGDCVSCHTAAGGKPFAGGKYMPTPFGEISVPNITPDTETGIGAWSEDDFYRALHEGVGRSGEYLYPVFPFPWYTKVTREDVSAIRAYLRTIPAVKAQRPPLKLAFPASIRESLLAWRTLFFKAGEFVPDPHQSQQANRGGYLVVGLGHCGECHNHHNLAGSSHWSGTLEGGEIEGWYAPNLTPDGREGVGAWSTPELAQFLKSGASRHAGVALGPMREVIDGSLSQLDTADVQAIAVYLKSVTPKQTFTAAPASEFTGPHPSRGAREFVTFCASCHGLHGQGFSNVIPPLTHNGAITAQGPQNAIRVVLGGLPARRGQAPMPAIGASMSDQQVTDVINYVRNAFGNAAPATAQAGMVAELRTQSKTVMTGDPADGCPVAPAADIAQMFTASGLQPKLTAMTQINMLQVIDGLVPSLRDGLHQSTPDDLVNAMTDAYCGVLKSRQMSGAARSETLGNFSELTYTQLKSNGRD